MDAKRPRQVWRTFERMVGTASAARAHPAGEAYARRGRRTRVREPGDRRRGLRRRGPADRVLWTAGARSAHRTERAGSGQCAGPTGRPVGPSLPWRGRGSGYFQEASEKFSCVSGLRLGGLTLSAKAMEGGELEMGSPGRRSMIWLFRSW